MLPACFFNLLVRAGGVRKGALEGRQILTNSHISDGPPEAYLEASWGAGGGPRNFEQQPLNLRSGSERHQQGHRLLLNAIVKLQVGQTTALMGSQRVQKTAISDITVF